MTTAMVQSCLRTTIVNKIIFANHTTTRAINDESTQELGGELAQALKEQAAAFEGVRITHL